MSATADELLARVREQTFGTHPGGLPAQLYAELTRTTDDRERARLAAGLVRCWVYGGESRRAHEFADLAVAAAERTGDTALIADALEAALLARWGPDDLAERGALTAQLSDVASYVADPRARVDAALWQLTVALEQLDGIAVARQLAILDALATESGTPEVRFFAESRGAMAALLADDPARAAVRTAAALAAAEAAGLADLEAVTHCLTAALALHTGDRAIVGAEAAAHVAHGLAVGVAGIAVGGARLHCAAGNFDEARLVLERVDLTVLARDVDWLPTVALAVVTAADTGRTDLVEAGYALLAPYAGRGIVDAGAIAFHGVVSDVLHRACVALGRSDDAEAHRVAAIDEYRRLGCGWWLARLGGSSTPAPGTRLAHVRPTGPDLWLVGFDGRSQVTRDIKGLHYIRELVRNAGTDVSALDLATRFAADTVPDTDTGPVLDARAKAEYRRRLAALDDAIADAAGWTEKATRLELERDALVDELTRATGFGGRDRTTGASSERARIAVRKAISSAIDRIGLQDPGFARLLRSSITTGRICRYDADPNNPIDWQV